MLGLGDVGEGGSQVRAKVVHGEAADHLVVVNQFDHHSRGGTAQHPSGDAETVAVCFGGRLGLVDVVVPQQGGFHLHLRRFKYFKTVDRLGFWPG